MVAVAVAQAALEALAQVINTLVLAAPEYRIVFLEYQIGTPEAVVDQQAALTDGLAVAALVVVATADNQLAHLEFRANQTQVVAVVVVVQVANQEPAEAVV
jgi:hypothetical protein